MEWEKNIEDILSYDEFKQLAGQYEEAYAKGEWKQALDLLWELVRRMRKVGDNLVAIMNENIAAKQKEIDLNEKIIAAQSMVINRMEIRLGGRNEPSKSNQRT